MQAAGQYLNNIVFLSFFPQLAEALISTPFQALTMSAKAGVLSYLCNELLCSRTICKYVISLGAGGWGGDLVSW